MSEFKKKLIEVALPLKAINSASAREKSIRHGQILRVPGLGATSVTYKLSELLGRSEVPA